MSEDRTSGTDAARRARIAWHAAADEAAWVGEAADAIAAALRSVLAAAPTAQLLLSGGTTPAPVYRALATRALEWARIVIGLVDDRDVDENADGSNARLVRETVLQGAAAAARFEPLRLAGHTLTDAVDAANARWSAAPAHCVVVFGMGDDGHTASLFPGARNLDAAFASGDAYVFIDATGCAVAGAYAHRISLSPHAFAGTQRLLLIRGAGKRAVFESALAAGAERDMPVRAAIDAAGTPLQVYWAP